MNDINNLLEKGLALPLIEDFYSLQGEGYNTGKPAYFIRLGGCDIGCSWCDTKFSWKSEVHKLTESKSIVEKAKSYPAKSIVVTGGEPTCYNLDFLCKELKKSGIKTFLETSGVYKLTGKWDWVCLSPKEHNPPLEEFYQKANELKVIINTKQDLVWAEKNRTRVSDNCKLLLQPEWSVYNNIVHDIVEYIKNNPVWSISLQAHKFMKIP